MNTYGDNAAMKKVLFGEKLEIEMSWFALTDVGLRRETNEDSFVASPPVFAVADGMGGHAAGDIASKTVAKFIAEATDQLNEGEALGEARLNDSLMKAVEETNRLVGDTGAGTTVTGVMFGDDETSPTWKVFNIGDSRVYQYFRGSLTQITADHSIVQHLIDTGAITAEEAEMHPHANVITRAVGFNEDPIPDYSELALIPGQRILICSDGLIKELTDIGLQHFMTTEETAEGAAKELVKQALGNSGRDNVTVIVIDVHAVGGDSGHSELEDPAKELFQSNDTEEIPVITSESGTETGTETGAEIVSGASTEASAEIVSEASPDNEK